MGPPSPHRKGSWSGSPATKGRVSEFFAGCVRRCPSRSCRCVSEKKLAGRRSIPRRSSRRWRRGSPR